MYDENLVRPGVIGTYSISDGDDFRVAIEATDIPGRRLFRVHRVLGDITKPERLQQAITNFLNDQGVTQRQVELPFL